MYAGGAQCCRFPMTVAQNTSVVRQLLRRQERSRLPDEPGEEAIRLTRIVTRNYEVELAAVAMRHGRGRAPSLRSSRCAICYQQINVDSSSVKKASEIGRS